MTHCAITSKSNASGVTMFENSIYKSPDYLSDLNACHEFEKTIRDNGEIHSQRRRYDGWLWGITAGRTISATAAQRCEAYLKTIGKWEEKMSDTPRTTAATKTYEQLETELTKMTDERDALLSAAQNRTT